MWWRQRFDLCDQKAESEKRRGKMKIIEGCADKKVVWSKQLQWKTVQNRAGSHRFC